MPLFQRPDGALVCDESNVRKMMPYLMRGRNESAVFHEQNYDLTRARPWLRAWNRSHPDTPTSLFHLLLYSLGRTFHERPGLNRFVSGSRIYQRNHVELSFAAKKEMDPSAPLVTVKLRIPRDQPFAELIQAAATAVAEARTDRETTIDKELKLVLMLPGPLVRGVMAALRVLDRVNLMPGAMIEHDPMYATAFLGNLGSLGLDNTFHHLYEYGTISFFGAIGTTKKAIVVGRDGQPIVRDTTQVRWTFDERINDGFYCATALKVAQQIVEDPERHIGGVSDAGSPLVHEPIADRARAVMP